MQNFFFNLKNIRCLTSKWYVSCNTKFPRNSSWIECVRKIQLISRCSL